MINSKQNNQYKNWLKLKQKKFRDQEQKYLVYGPHLVEEALKAGVVLEIITSNEHTEGTYISQSLMRELNVTQTPYDIMAVCKMISKSIESDKILILEDIQDPDNVGALLRSASAFGFNQVLLSDKCANIYNEKVIRASKGAIFHIEHKITDIYEAVSNLKTSGYKIYITGIRGANVVLDANKVVLVLGNEGSGISNKMKQLVNSTLTIPTRNVESLNVSIAGAILMYEWSKLWE